MVFKGAALILALGIISTTGPRALAKPEGPGAIPSVKQTQFLPPPKDLRDSRYCEIIPLFRSGLNFDVPVFNSVGLNNCPADLWARQNAKELASTYDAFFVKLNGPRYWMMDSITAEAATKFGRVVEFNGLQLRQRAVMKFDLKNLLNHQRGYVPIAVDRNSTFLYLKGKKVYELRAPSGEVYRLQSYAQIVDPNLKIADLERLGDRLKLPKGWSFQVRVLDKDSELRANGVAYVLQDELQNSYQKIIDKP
jgi:hypothetical protein